MPRQLVRDPIYHQLNQALRELISSADFAAGDRFLTERQVSERFRVSRATANKALSNLVAEGVLEVRSGPDEDSPERDREDALLGAARLRDAGDPLGALDLLRHALQREPEDELLIAALEDTTRQARECVERVLGDARRIPALSVRPAEIDRRLRRPTELLVASRVNADWTASALARVCPADSEAGRTIRTAGSCGLLSASRRDPTWQPGPAQWSRAGRPAGWRQSGGESRAAGLWQGLGALCTWRNGVRLPLLAGAAWARAGLQDLCAPHRCRPCKPTGPGRWRSRWWFFTHHSMAAGEVVPDTHHLILPTDLAPGRYLLWAGMYAHETVRNLAVVSADVPTADDRVLLGEIEVEVL